ncbi:MAG: hypothetical protein Q7R81_07080 [Candidatus Peregrinibacteria bacterium]|nr:hypothetical protein [Candidatus Peregrinibacteria bacterium]
MKRPSGFLAAIALVLAPSIGFANPLDVPADSWYSSTVSSFVNAGYFEATQPFRPTEKATRAEFVQLLVNLQGGVTHAPFTIQSFDDVAPSNPFFKYFEEAGLAGWMKGAGSCYGQHPCTANPNNPINRAEAATLMIRAFKLEMNSQMPYFSDNTPNEWFTLPINSAASLCILQGDGGEKRVRPADNMIRAEMITMLQRALQRLHYPNCVAPTGFSLPNANAKSAQPTQSVSSSSTSSIQSSSQSSSSSIFPIDSAMTLSIIKFLAPTEQNVKTIEKNMEYYNDDSHREFVQEMMGYLFTIEEASAKLEFYQKQSETRGLTPDEVKEVYALMDQINAVVLKGNNMLK